MTRFTTTIAAVAASFILAAAPIAEACTREKGSGLVICIVGREKGSGLVICIVWRAAIRSPIWPDRFASNSKARCITSWRAAMPG